MQSRPIPGPVSVSIPVLDFSRHFGTSDWASKLQDVVTDILQIGTIVDNYTAPLVGRTSYLIPLGLIYIVPFVIAVLLVFIPESPRWLMGSFLSMMLFCPLVNRYQNKEK
jgi:Na+/melibiose symporter-like transporter